MWRFFNSQFPLNSLLKRKDEERQDIFIVIECKIDLHTCRMKIVNVINISFHIAPFKRSVSATEQQCTTISIISDECVEDDETFHLQLSTHDESVMLNPATANVTILNNDCKFLRPSLSKVHKKLQTCC